MKQFFRYLSLFLVVLLTAGSLTALAVKEQILKPELYTSALKEAGAYQVVEDVLVTKATAYIETTAKQLVTEMQTRITPQTEVGNRIEPLVGWYLNDLIGKQTQPLVASIAANLKIAESMETVVGKGIGYAVGWLNGTQPDPKFLAYIPEPDKLEAVKAEGVVPFVVSQIKQDVKMADLPPCSENQVATNLKLVVEGRVDEVSCYSPAIRTALEKAGQVMAPKIAQTQLALTLEAYLEKYQVKTLANDMFEAVLNLSQFKQSLNNLKANLVLLEQSAKKALWASMLFLIIGLWLTEKRRLKTLFATYLWVGIVMVAGAGTYTVAAVSQIEKMIPTEFVRITDPSISSELNQNLAQSLEQAVTLMVADVVTPVKFMGWSILLLSLIGLTITGLVNKNQEKKAALKQQQPELFEEVPEISEAVETAAIVKAKTTKSKSTKSKKTKKK